MPGNFYQVTLADIAAWPPPNYDHPKDTRNWLPEFALVWQAVTTVLVLGRVYLRARKQAGAWGLDDSLIVMAWLFSIGMTVLACLEGWKYNLNRHTWDVIPVNYMNAAFAGWLTQLCFLWSTYGIKNSVLLFYRRMVKDTVTRSWMYTIWTFLFVTNGMYIGAFVTFMKICTPLESYWLAYRFNPPYTVDFHCINGSAFDLSVSVLLGFSDIWSVAIPCLMLRHYQLEVTFKQKLGLNLIFCLGFLATGAGVARSYYLWQMANKPDVFWNGFSLFAWSLVEVHLGIICACLPSLRAFLRKVRDPAWRSNLSNGGRRSVAEAYYPPTGAPPPTAITARDSRRWSQPGRRFSSHNKDSWHTQTTEMSAVRTVRDFPPHRPLSPHSPASTLHSPGSFLFPLEKSDTGVDVSLYPKHSVEDLGAV